MGIKIFWSFLPVATLWVCHWIGYEYLSFPSENWWDIPLLITLTFAFTVSLFIAIGNVLNK